MTLEIVYLFIFSLLLAFVEVQVEGQHGWAAQLPAWRPKGNVWYVRVFKQLFGNKELTGYHIAIGLLILFSLHMFYFWQGSWSWQQELRVISFFFLVAVVWDFLWFVINPHFGWKKFKPMFIAWHRSWLGPWPADYYVGVALYVVLFSVSYGRGWYLGLGDGLWILLWISMLVGTTMLIRSAYDRFS